MPALRHPNKNKCLTKDDIYRTEIELPEDIFDYCQENLDVHRDFERASGAMAVRYTNGKILESADHIWKPIHRETAGSVTQRRLTAG